MSDLDKSVSGDWIKATAYFGHAPHLVPVQLFVEGDDDVLVWKEAVKLYKSKYDIKVVTNKAVNPAESNGKAKLLTMDGLCSNKIVAVDADYDLLVDNYSKYTEKVRNGQFVLNTTWYSIENILLQKTDKIKAVESFSSAIYDMFTHHIAKIECGEESQPIKHFGKILNDLHVQKYFANNAFDAIKSEYYIQHREEMALHKANIEAVKLKLTGHGYTESDIWKLMRGHNLWDTVVKPQIVKELDQRVNDGIRKQREAGKPVDRCKVMNELGIETSISDYVDHQFYCDMTGVEIPIQTRKKLDIIFPMS